MKILILCKAAYRTTFFLDGSRISKKKADLEISNSKTIERGGVSWYNLKGCKGIYGEKTKLFLY